MYGSSYVKLFENDLVLLFSTKKFTHLHFINQENTGHPENFAYLCFFILARNGFSESLRNVVFLHPFHGSRQTK
jgi:hypothetical protein